MENISKEINVLVYGHFHTGFIKEKDGVINNWASQEGSVPFLPQKFN